MPVLTIAATWSADVGSTGAQYPGDTEDTLGFFEGATEYRIPSRFVLSQLPADAIISDVSLLNNVLGFESGANRPFSIGRYGSNGQTDPSKQNATTNYSNCDLIANPTWVYVSGKTEFQTVGEISISLGGAGSQVVLDILAAKAVDLFSIAIAQEPPLVGNNSSRMSEYNVALGPRLQITYTRPVKVGFKTFPLKMLRRS